MAQSKTQYVCDNCGNTFLKMMGRCTSCGEYGTIREFVVKETKSKKSLTKNVMAVPPSQISDSDYERTELFSEELNRVLGGGLIDGTIILIGGSPGAGKTTLCTQLMGDLANNEHTVLYASAEESMQQIKYRLNRFNINSDNFLILESDNVDEIINQADLIKPSVIVVDSIQTIHSDAMESAAGTVSQIRECASRLQWFGKNNDISVIIIGHVTKDNTIAGPKVLEHLVDVTLYLEDDDAGTYRILRSIKNRFGAAPEIGIFEMDYDGMKDVLDPSGILLSGHHGETSGTSIGVMLEGTRSILSEIQSLVENTEYATPLRSATGLDRQRLSMISAVLSKHARLPLHTRNVMVNIVGGMSTKDIALDLPMACAMISSFLDIALPYDTVAIGQIDLSGRIRAVPQMTQRIQTAYKIGLRSFILPAAKGGYSHIKEDVSAIKIHEIQYVSEIPDLVQSLTLSK